MAHKGKAKKRIAMLGYGSQGKALALNLRDSGYSVTVGLRPRSKTRKAIDREQGIRAATIPEAVEQADIVCFAFPDHLHRKVFGRSILKHLHDAQMLWFLHGMSVHFGLVAPPEAVDVVLLAPHAPGPAVREKYLTDKSVSAFYAIHQDVTGKAESGVVQLARAAGFSRGHLLETTFAEEAIGDLFGEQAVLCGGLAMLIKSGFDTLVANGHDPDHAYLEVAYQLDLIVELIKRHGIRGMFDRVSVAARVGSLEAGPFLINESVLARMQLLYRRIERGEFAERLDELSDSGISGLRQALRSLTDPRLERAVRKFSSK